MIAQSVGRPAVRMAGVLDDATFRSALVRERRMADRTNGSLLVLLARPTGAFAAGDIWRKLADSLAASALESDVIGWYERNQVLALLRSDVEGAIVGAASALRTSVTRELARRREGATETAIAFDCRAYPPAAKPSEVEPLDSLLHDRRADSPGARRRERMKRTVDVIGSLVLLAAFAPLFLLIAVLVRFRSPGPVLFRQVRVGQKGRPFRMLKFRTMHANVSEGIHQEYVNWFIKSSGKAGACQGRPLFKLANDPRITRVGVLLRKSSLDELPQLWNVLRGEMSLVGPRPPLPYEVEQYERWHCQRMFEAKPGMTGLWQVTGRSRTTFDDMVRLDLRYARTHTLLTDLRILLATPRAVISGKGAC